MSYCSQCGNELPQGARFCASCGAAVPLAEASPEPSQPDAQLQIGAETGTTPPPTTSQIPKDVRNMASFAGLTGIPLANILGPLFVWLMKRKESSFIDAHGKEALNFQISMTIYIIVSAILILVLVGILMLVGLLVFDIIVVIVAAVRANGGQEYRYPLAIRFVK